MKHNIILLISIILILTANCINSEDNPINEMLKIKANTELSQLLKYPFKISESPSKRYLFVFAKGVEPLESKNKLKQNALKKDFTIDGFKFLKGEYKWWFIFDFVKKKIIVKGSNLVLFDDKPAWEEKNNILKLMTAISDSEDFLFYKEINNKKPYMIYIYCGNKNPYLFSDNKKYIAYNVVTKVDDISGMPTEIGIKITELENKKDIVTLTPKTKNGELAIIRWESNKKLIYREVNKKQGIDKEISFIITE